MFDRKSCPVDELYDIWTVVKSRVTKFSDTGRHDTAMSYPLPFLHHGSTCHEISNIPRPGAKGIVSSTTRRELRREEQLEGRIPRSHVCADGIANGSPREFPLVTKGIFILAEAIAKTLRIGIATGSIGMANMMSWSIPGCKTTSDSNTTVIVSRRALWEAS